MAAIAVVVDVGVQRSHVEQSQGAEKPGSSSALDFFRRIFARVVDYVTWIRRFFVFTVAKEGNLEVKEERGILKNEIKVEEGVLVEASGVPAADLTEIVVSPKETITQGPLDDDLKVMELSHENCGSKCTTQIKVGEQWGFSDALHEPTPSAENHEGRAGQHTPATEQFTSNSFQDGPNSVSCDSRVEELHHEDCGNKCTTQITNKDLETCVAYKPALSAEDHEEGTIEHALVTNEQSTSDDPLQQGPVSVTCEPAKAFPLELNDCHCKADPVPECHTEEENVLQEELNDEHCTADAHQNGRIQYQNTSQEEELEDVVTSEKLKDGSLESLKLNTSSPALRKQLSILNAIVGEQLTNYLQFLERSVVPGKAEHATWNPKTTHRRAIILATLVAIAVWARNSRHLHKSMPRIKGSAINVHIRSRL